MGFSLEMFFAELVGIIEDTETDEIDKLEALEAAIKAGQEYARVCSMIN